ncbi:hypothetical protein COU91_04225 [Candidatus Saccharibacteria bacterium CG10_big_fil_rev_8_21_14_0_10_47_8]|nr:MAG: hypothetical protein COU91_04225 [Candidatus Saccharibacteria bacterium CG10_big_fil_rev_8_21_14_0_10_47_8]
MPDKTNNPKLRKSINEEPAFELPDDLVIDPAAIGEYYDRLSEEEKREFAIRAALGHAALEKLVSLDPKTGLLQYVKFKELVVNRTSLSLRRREQDPTITNSHGLILLDLDDFKKLNTGLGYDRTDRNALIPAAEAIRQHLREGDLAARFGGEEFVIFLPSTSGDNTLVVARKVQAAINAIEPTAGKSLGVSIAYAQLPQGEEYDKVFGTVNAALIKAKEIEGKNSIVPTEKLAE